MSDAASSMKSVRHNLAVGQLLATILDAAVIVAVVCMGRFMQPRVELGQTIGTVAIGYSLAIASVSGLWGFTRLPLTPLIALSGFLLPIFAMSLSGASREAIAVGAVVLTFAVTVQFLVVQAPYWLTRSWLNLRAIPKSEMPTVTRVASLQYSLLEVLFAVTMAAIALGIGRWAIHLGIYAREQRDGGLEAIAAFGLLVGFGALVAWSLAWAALSRSASLWKLASAIFVTAVLMIGTYSVLPSVTPGPSGSSFWLFFAPLPFYLLTHLLAARLCGYRLVRSL